jgi:threonine/homoserine/homoserine lactone efflux protein
LTRLLWAGRGTVTPWPGAEGVASVPGVIPADRLLAFSAAAFALIVVPGPSVLFVVSRGVTLGRKAALTTVVGNATGAYTQVVGVALGLGAVVERSIVAFNAIKFVGAAYLVVLGVQALRHRRDHVAATSTATEQVKSMRRIYRDGFVVGVANPKVIVFFAAILPQFANPAAGSVTVQILLLGLVFVAIALLSDGAWGVAAGTAREWLRRSPRLLESFQGFGGLVMIGLGARLLFTGRKD